MTHKIYQIDEIISAIIIDINEDNIYNEISENIVSICEGCSDTDLDTIKIRLKDYLEPKKIRQRHGAVAEFYVHLFLKSLGYKQNFLFMNLEENSIKKGFDGYYTYNGDEWIVESKSGINIKHKSKIVEAYEDLKKKLTTKEKNNPWENAYNHAAHIAVGADISIVKKLKSLSNNYAKNIHLPLDKYNLMPCGTVFDHDASSETVKDVIYNEICPIVSDMEYRKLCIIAISNRAYMAFLRFIGLEG